MIYTVILLIIYYVLYILYYILCMSDGMYPITIVIDTPAPQKECSIGVWWSIPLIIGDKYLIF